jgi:hypothetical protein
LQAVVGDKQLLLSLPLTPLTYHVVLAKTVGARDRNKARSGRLINCRDFMMFAPFRLFCCPY